MTSATGETRDIPATQGGDAEQETTGITDDPPAIVPALHPSDDDGQHDDVDSVISDDGASTTASLSASIMEYRSLHGRTYHSDKHDAQYWGPIDEQQIEAMDINHHFLTLILGDKLHLAPISKDIEKVLDIGTGSGIWAIDFADQHPNAEVIGTDLSPIQPAWCPPNLKFEIDDAEQQWTFAPSSFDYIHMRYLMGSIQDWPRLFRQAYAALKPGGYVESYEAEPDFRSDDGTVQPDSAMAQWRDLFMEGGKKLGRPFDVVSADTQARSIRDAGFANVTVKNVKAPIGGWAADPRMREVGQYAQLALEQDLEGYVTFLWNTVLQMGSAEEMHVFLMKFRRELRTRGIHSYVPQKVVYAQKPESA